MDHVDFLTSPEQVAEYVKKFRYTLLDFQTQMSVIGLVILERVCVPSQGLLLAQRHPCGDAASSGQEHPHEDAGGGQDQPPWHNARYAPGPLVLGGIPAPSTGTCFKPGFILVWI